ncbi:hypothetical protein [Agromyces sp. GXQ0307]|uniref:hypothetical protein n=1 Tax=Agromyces sp. GXQ0307 TaxID=3377835 RepID=UPI00383B9A2F
MRNLTRTTVLVAAVAVIAGLGLAAPAHAAPPAKSNAPVASATAGTPDDDAVTIDYAINRGAQAVADQACDVDGTPVACDAAADTTTKKASTYSVDLGDLTDGDHRFTVTFTLTDGSSATAAAGFTIDAAPTLEEVCASFTGTLTEPAFDEGSYWTCIAEPYTGTITDTSELLLFGLNALRPYCPSNNFDLSYASGSPVSSAGWYCRMV